MVSSEQISSIIKQFNDDGRSGTFAEFIAVLFKNKLIEIYLGDSFEEASYDSQISTSYPSVFCGKVVGAYRECLIINGISSSKGKPIKFGNIVLINERAIRGLTEMDGNGTIDQMFVKSGSSEAEDIRNLIKNNE